MAKRPLLHFKVDMDKIRPDVTYQFMKSVTKKYGKNYRILITPFDLSVPNNDTPVLNFDGIEFTYEQIDEAIHDYLVKSHKENK